MAESFRSGLEAVSRPSMKWACLLLDAVPSLSLCDPSSGSSCGVAVIASNVIFPNMKRQYFSGSLGGFDVCGQRFDWSLLRNRCGSRHVGGGLSLDVATDFSSL